MIKIAQESKPFNAGFNLPRKYRPLQLAGIVGQPQATDILRSFVRSATESAEPMAFLFHGPTGVGKTASAWALAAELGCDMGDPEMGGVFEIPSGQQDAFAVKALLDTLRLRPLMGSGWKVAIINEADKMTEQAEAIWLDGLEKLPTKTVVIFTTNNTAKLSGRLATRTMAIEFTGEPSKLRNSLGAYARKVWKQETGERLPQLPKGLGLIPSTTPTVSFRLALQQLAGYLMTGEVPAETVEFCEVKESSTNVGTVAAQKAWETRRSKSKESK